MSADTLQPDSHVIFIANPRKQSDQTIAWFPVVRFKGIKLLSVNVIKSMLVLSGYDYLAIYKCPSEEQLPDQSQPNLEMTHITSGSEQSKLKLESYRFISGQRIKDELESVKREEASFSYCREKLNSFLKIYLKYIFIKFTLSSLLTCLFYTYDRHGQSRHLNNLTIWLYLRRLDQFIGNPLYPIGNLGLVAYLLSSIMTYYSVVIVPDCHKQDKPIDLTIVRLLFHPVLEFNRLDTSLEIKVDDLIRSTRRFEQQKLRRLYLNQREHSKHKLSCAKLTQKFASSLERQRMKLHWIKSNFLYLLRPATFTRDYCQHLQNSVNLGLFVMVYGSLWFLVMYSAVFYWSYEGKCKMKGIKFTHCPVTDAFTGRELLFLAEVFIAGALFSLTFLINWILVIMICLHQVKLIDTLKRELRVRISDLRSCMMHKKEMGGGCSTEEFNGSEEDKLETILTVTLIKLLVSREELMFGNRILTELMKNMLLFALIFSTAIVLFKHMSYDTDSKIYYYINSSNTLISWLPINLMGLACARIHSRFESIEPLCFSIIAQITNSNPDEAQQFESVIKILLRKLTYSSNFISQINSVRPFNVVISYRRLISLNFLVISLYSITKMWFSDRRLIQANSYDLSNVILGPGDVIN